MSDKMKFETQNLTAENVAKIAELFPGAVSEGKVNFDLLRTMLGDEVFKDEAYEFTWVGKRAAIAEGGRPIRKTLRPVVQDEAVPTGTDSTGKPYSSSGSRDWDTTENLYIEGDNLEVLKLLQESYLGKIKMIYIDPPYNTGNDFIYQDDFAKSKEEYDEEAGVYNEEGNRLFLNTESNGRFHSDWCSMMYPRLVLARNLLRDDGVVFISSDDNEVTNLVKICDEILGESNRIRILVWKKKYTGGKGSSTFADYHEYIIAYAKKGCYLSDFSMDRPDEEKLKFELQDEFLEHRGKYYLRPLKSNLDPRPTLVYPIELPDGTSITTQWICARDTYERLLSEGRIAIKKKRDGKYQVYKKFYENDDEGKVKIPSFLEISNNNEAKEELKALFDVTQTRGLPFSTPKPTKLLKFFIMNFTQKKDIILDFFSGSSSTAHAVMQLNAEDGGKRKFIMVQLPEVCAEGTEAAKAGYKNICEIGKERIRRAGNKVKAEAGLNGQDLDIGFRVLKVDESNMNDVYYAAGDYTQDMLGQMEDNIKSDRTDLDLLFGCLLDWGLPLSMPHTHETIDGFTVHTYNNGDLVACFDEHVSEKAVREIASRQPLRAVFRDSSFTSSPEKINVFEIFKLLAPNTTVKVL